MRLLVVVIARDLCFKLMRAQIGWKMASVMSTIRGMALTTILGREVSAADRNDADPHGLHPEGPFDFGDGD